MCTLVTSVNCKFRVGAVLGSCFYTAEQVQKLALPLNDESG